MAAKMTRDYHHVKSLGVPLNTMVKEARVLMVGAGGIGCELLKNLVLTGFGEVHIVDLDTIDLSNLNRQFLFRHEHIKKSKALVAKEAAHKFNPKVKLEAYHANIKDPQFNVGWFKSFNMVFNALDNLDARRYVNRMCMAADVPLIESGTTGFNGQVQVIKKGITACYDCHEKATPTTYPVCTIRSTPSQPIHCIVWGKSYLLSEMFGVSEDESPELDNSEDAENAEEIKQLRQEAQALKEIRAAMGTDAFSQMVFDKVYKTDIDRLRSTEELWKFRRRPEPLEYDTVNAKVPEEAAAKEAVIKDGQRVWTVEENLVVFKDSLERLSKRYRDMQSAKLANDSDVKVPSTAEPIITFDKDDEDCLDFVTASANLRSIIFGIDTKSRFDVKQIAGNIIPAIATTNAIVAGLCVLESFKVLRGEYNSVKEVFVTPFAQERLLGPDKLRSPNPDCPICSVAQTRLLVDMSRATLNNLVEDFLKLELGYGEEIAVAAADNPLYDPDETENLTKKLSELGIKNGSFLYVRDEDDEHPKGPRVNLVLNVQESKAALEDKPIKSLDFHIDSASAEPSSPIARRKKPIPAPAPELMTNGHMNGVAAPNGISNGTKKRTAAEALDEEDSTPVKKSKMAASKGDDDLIEIVNLDEDQSIVID